jgi:hypothetical protein
VLQGTTRQHAHPLAVGRCAITAEPLGRVTARRRARRGSVERPINGRLVRAALLLVVPALLLASFTVAHPGPLPAPLLPPSFDTASAVATTTELARFHPSRVPGTALAEEAAGWYADKLALYDLEAREDTWEETIPGLGRVRLRNIVTTVPGDSANAIVVVAHRDNTGQGPGANVNASGTAALLELARGYAQLGTVTGRPRPQHTLVFLSSDGGAYGGYGAARFAATSPLRNRLIAVVSLDGIAGRARPRLVLSGLGSRSPAPALVRTASVRVAEQTTREPVRPDWLTQLVDLGIPFGYGEQAPFLERGISAVRLATVGDGATDAATDTPENLDVARFDRLGRAAETLLASLDASVALAGGTAGSLYLGNRVVRGWAIELVLLASLVPFLAGSVDLYVRCRGRGLPLRGAWLALRTRLGVWLWVGAVVALGALVGIFPRDGSLPPAPDSPAVSGWPVGGLLGLLALATLGWTRTWLRSRGNAPAGPADELAGYAVALVGLGGVAVAVAVANPYTLVFLVPSLYAWLWLPQVHARSGWARDALYGAGLVGPALALVAVAQQLDLGLDAPLYLTALMTLGFVPWLTVLALLAWAAVATQLGALAGGRYTPGGRPVSDRPFG